jgi:uncharacterized protein
MKKVIVKVQANAKRTKIYNSNKTEDGLDCYQAYVTVPPIKGKANSELLKLLSKFFQIPRSHIVILSGETSQKKIIGMLED